MPVAGQGPSLECAYIGLGANLADPVRQVQQAFLDLQRLPLSRVLAHSRLYRTAPVGPPDQPDFVNAAVRIETGLEPMALLAALQAIERSHGRIRDGRRWGPRTLDLDILLFGNRCLNVPGLHLPHPQMHRRGFVLVPLAEVAESGLVVPGRGTLRELLAALPGGGIEPLAPDARLSATPMPG